MEQGYAKVCSYYLPVTLYAPFHRITQDLKDKVSLGKDEDSKQISEVKEDQQDGGVVSGGKKKKKKKKKDKAGDAGNVAEVEKDEVRRISEACFNLKIYVHHENCALLFTLQCCYVEIYLSIYG